MKTLQNYKKQFEILFTEQGSYKVQGNYLDVWQFIESMAKEMLADDIKVVQAIKNISNENADRNWFDALHCVISTLEAHKSNILGEQK